MAEVQAPFDVFEQFSGSASPGRPGGAQFSESAVSPTPTEESGDPHLQGYVADAREALLRGGFAPGRRSKQLSVRIDPDLLAAAAKRLGVRSTSATVEAGLLLLAGTDTYGAWLVSLAGSWPEDVEIDV